MVVVPLKMSLHRPVMAVTGMDSVEQVGDNADSDDDSKAPQRILAGRGHQEDGTKDAEAAGDWAQRRDKALWLEDLQVEEHTLGRVLHRRWSTKVDLWVKITSGKA